MNEFVPCPFDGLATPFWKINNTFYHTIQLPYPFIASTSPSGLVIQSVDRFLTGTSLQCFAASGSESSPRALKSSVGIVTVIFDPETGKCLTYSKTDFRNHVSLDIHVILYYMT